MRDERVDYVRSWSDKTDVAVARFMPWIGIGRSKYQNWVTRLGRACGETANSARYVSPRPGSGATLRCCP